MRFIIGESLLLAMFGAVFGLILAQFALRSIQALQIAAIRRLAEARLHPAVLAGMLAGALGAIWVTRYFTTLLLSAHSIR